VALDADKLATAIKEALGFADQPTSKETKAMAKAFIKQLTNYAKVSFSTGQITGTCPPGGPLANGAGAGGKLSGLSASGLADDLASSKGGKATAEIKDLASAFCDHIQTAIVKFDSEKVAGVCSNSATSPGPFVGQATGGKLTGLSGDTLASMIAAKSHGGKVSDPLKKKAKAIVSHIMTNGEAFFASGITGVAPTGGGNLEQGMGVGGKVK